MIQKTSVFDHSNAFATLFIEDQQYRSKKNYGNIVLNEGASLLRSKRRSFQWFHFHVELL